MRSYGVSGRWAALPVLPVDGPNTLCLPGGRDALATDSRRGGDTMTKEPYVKPQIRSEELEPGALGGNLSGGNHDHDHDHDGGCDWEWCPWF